MVLPTILSIFLSDRIHIFLYLYLNPTKLLEIQKYGGFIPGIARADCVVPTMVLPASLAGALFLGIIAILPSIARQLSGVDLTCRRYRGSDRCVRGT